MVTETHPRRTLGLSDMTMKSDWHHGLTGSNDLCGGAGSSTMIVSPARTSPSEITTPVILAYTASRRVIMGSSQ